MFSCGCRCGRDRHVSNAVCTNELSPLLRQSDTTIMGRGQMKFSGGKVTAVPCHCWLLQKSTSLHENNNFLVFRDRCISMLCCVAAAHYPHEGSRFPHNGCVCVGVFVCLEWPDEVLLGPVSPTLNAFLSSCAGPVPSFPGPVPSSAGPVPSCAGPVRLCAGPVPSCPGPVPWCPGRVCACVVHDFHLMLA